MAAAALLAWITLIALPCAPASAQQDADASQPATTSLAEAFFIQRHPRTGRVEWLGSGIIWVLIASSAASLAYLTTTAMRTRTSHFAPAPLVASLEPLIMDNSLGRARELASAHSSDLASAVSAALSSKHTDHASRVQAAQQAAEEGAVRRLRAIEPLAIVGNIAPMLGLFGTVYGMILAFREIVASGGSPDPQGLAAGIGTALVTTFWGLVVAIPAVAGHAALRNAIDERSLRAARTADELLDHLR